MQTYKIEIKGTTPYFFSQPMKTAKVPKTDKQKQEYALKQVYVNDDDILYFPARQIKGAMISGAQMAKLKIERSVKRTTDLFKTNYLMITPEEIIFEPKRGIDDVLLVEDFIRIAGIWTFFAYIESDWTAQFNLIFSDIFEPTFIKEALENSGFLCGIGGRRPYNGTFEILNFENVPL